MRPRGSSSSRVTPRRDPTGDRTRLPAVSGPRTSGQGRGQPRTPPDGLVSLVRSGTVDAELAALVWLLVEANVSAVVASDDAAAAAAVRDVLLELRRETTGVARLAGTEESFAWLPESGELGWHEGGSGGAVGERRPAAHPGSTILVADLVPDAPRGTWGERALVAIRAASLGYALLATARGATLEAVLAALAARPVGALDDELTRLGIVLIADRAASGVRITAAHYLRPVSRDQEGHIRRSPPAVLATWDPGTDGFEHFAWGITDELAGRIGMARAELEREQAGRAEQLSGMAGHPG